MSKNFLRDIIILPVLVLVIAACEPKVRTWKLTSPDKSISIILTHTRLVEEKKNELSYQVLLETDSGSIEMINPSPLGIAREDANFTDQLTFHSEGEEIEFSDNYELISGKKRVVEYSGNELSVTFKNDSNQLLCVDLRALNDGVAFRYRFPENDSLPYTVTGEITSFKIPLPGKAWIHPYDTITKYTPAYETYYTNGTDIGAKAPGGQGWAFPALFNVNNAWMLLTEANLSDNFYGAHLQPEVVDGTYMIRLPEKEEALGTCEVEPASTLPWAMPWRVIMVSKNLADIVESTLIQDLSDANVVDDLSWIKPGRVSWSWWSDHDSPQSFEKLQHFVDLSVEMGWEYSLVDANWNTMKGGNLEELVQYANDKGIGILVWYNSGGPHNTVGEQLRDAMHIKERRREEFAKLQEWGVKGVKIDFFQSDKPEIIKQYHDILKDAVDYQILINFHGCTMPRGWERKYPHLMSMEAVRGAECYSFDSRFPEAAPWYNTILPFTRNAVGPMDYTPVAFSDQTYPHKTTYGHEIALPIVFQSSLLHFADKVSIFQELPDFAKDYLKEVPVSWDQTKFLEGYPGKYAVIAREKDGAWYFGGINGTGDTLNIDLKLPFILEGSYLAEIITDGKKDRSFMYYKKPFNNSTTLNLELKPFGGFAGKLMDFKEMEE
jgi:hypothetical protein